MNPILAAALALTNAGVSIVPTLPGGEKKPAMPWKPYTQKRPTLEQVTQWYTQNPHWGIAAISGQVSGNLIMVELEGRAAGEFAALKELAHDSGIGTLWDKATAGWFEASPTGGLHWFVRSTEPVPGNQKLARAADKLVLAETRGENGYTIVAPTGPEHHTLNRPWTLLAGGPRTIPVLTPEELTDFLTLFRTLDQTPPPPAATGGPISPFPVTTSPGGRLKPGDDYENKVGWAEILTPHGWVVAFQRGQTIYWRRPGKNTGMSATTGNATDRDRLYVFTTSTEFEAETPYTKFGAYALLNHAGDHAAAAKQLASEGYGESLADVVIDLPKAPTTQPTDAGNGVDGQLATVIDIDDHPRVKHSGQLHEAANGKYLVDAYGDRIRYITDRDRWLHWNGHTWETTGRGAAPIKQLAVTALEALPAVSKEEQRFRLKSLGSAGISNTLTLAATDPRIAIQQSDLDSHPGELNTPGGIVDLHTGRLLRSDPTKLHTRSTLITPDWQMPTPRWNTFLAETFTGHQGLDTYVQQLAGYAATGYVRTQILPFLYGAGANGKSVLADVLMRLLHDYAEPAPANFLMMTQTQHPTEIARLQGARMVVASEVPEGGKFDEVKVKQLTGGDTLTARYMHGDFFTFQPTHKLWLLGNHQPKVSAGGYSFWRRLRQIPFTNIVPENKRDLALADKLINQEGPGILAWIINGAVNYLTHGLNEPTEVLEATKAYERDEDALQRFVDDRLIIGGGNLVRVARKTMRHEYTAWCKLEGVTPASANAFTRELALRFNIGTTKSNGAHFYTGVTLLADEDTPEEDPRPGSFGDLGGGVF
ncbi:DNA primase [Actinomycetaceae bacterium WB03_NA08]|uniref:DNA primase n=1 Tax=Scrofimicrobium canadense TaxID=2652290 RepID=A0A6N7VT86_9ACTO|nr:phage/plasmid primase, P4 family [Scrofimicrobium canadense]MSS84989.1 DNA primase [Scrofimicrobium canadense]